MCFVCNWVCICVFQKPTLTYIEHTNGRFIVSCIFSLTLILNKVDIPTLK